MAYGAGERGKCPHCGVAVLFEDVEVVSAYGEEGNYGSEELTSPSYYEGAESIKLTFGACPNCSNLVVSGTPVQILESASPKNLKFRIVEPEILLWPRQTSRNPVPESVPPMIASDYREAALVLDLSPKSSAALSRRCLQALLRERGFNQRDLYDQIEAAKTTLPLYARKSVDAIRNFGNFSAHQTKDKGTGDIIDVEPGEAEWTLDVLDILFDHYYVKPLEEQTKLDALNAKLKAAGKPTIS